jgi:phosphopantothenoylcysteine synthetase/decarboxylase
MIMRLLVTAGNTRTPIDQVRCITNIFTGRTGAGIALAAYERGHSVTLLTSQPEVMDKLREHALEPPRWSSIAYTTFDDLERLLERAVTEAGFDAIVHCAAVSDFRVAGIYAPGPGSCFDGDTDRWIGEPKLQRQADSKVKSAMPELWLRLLPTAKLVDRIRTGWGFRGILVKFKLEVGMEAPALEALAEQSRRQSDADLMVANTLEGMSKWALLGPVAGRYERIHRNELPQRLLDAVESLHEAREHG